MLRKSLFILALAIAALWLRNTSLFSPPLGDDTPQMLAHRGVHQVYDRTHLGRDDCTAIRWIDTGHTYLENTIPSMRAAIAAGADVIELDIALTTDGQFAVFHDYTLDCRTEATGPIRDYAMADLKRLDIGYGYTADGVTFPFRGQGVGLMPTLPEVFDTFPDTKFLINFKLRHAGEGVAFANFLTANPHYRANVWAVYGGHAPSKAVADRIDGVRYYSRQTAKACLKAYALTGWTARVPDACHNSLVPVPINYAPWLWGWPHAFEQRMAQAGSTVILLGPRAAGARGSTGFDTPEEVARIPRGFGGMVWTNRIARVGARASGN